MTEGLSFYRLLSSLECAEVMDRIYLAREHWIRREEGFYTLGVASYLDVHMSQDPAKTYYSILDESNALLLAHFGDVLEPVRATIEDVVELPVRYAENLALPGFHIFLETALHWLGKSPSSPHVDRQYRTLGFPEYLSPERALSVTLPIRLPVAGGGLTTWPVTRVRANDAATHFPSIDRTIGDSEWLDAVVATTRSKHDRYAVGELVIHSGEILHRISPIRSVSPGDERVTLQGHAARRDGEWVLYW